MFMESAAGKDYIYPPINSSNEIRLITIKAGHEPDLIECFLAHVSLSDNPQYEALSYVWGDLNVRLPIILEGCNFSVTSNLGTALSYLRLPNANRIMWIDAICIDQNNLAERESQIKHMRDIYQGAERVVSWMDALETDVVVAQTACLLWEGRDHDFSIAWLRNALTNDFECLRRVPGIAQVCSRVSGYWSRMWITQEVALARKGVVKWQKLEIPYEYFAEFSNTLTEVLMDMEWTREHVIPKLLLGLTTCSQIIGRCDIVRRITPSTPLLDLLRQNRYKNATDSRDKVYALLGLSDMVPNSHEGIIVDYSENWSKRDVYTGAVRAVVHKTSRLDIICNARPYAYDPDSGPSPEGQKLEGPFWTPTWAPDWDSHFSTASLDAIEGRLGAAGGMPANVEFYNDINVMKAQGICVGTAGTFGRCLPSRVMVMDPKEIILCGEIFHEWLQICRSFAGDSADTFDTFCKTLNFGSEAPSGLQDLLAGESQCLDPSDSPSSSSPADVYFPPIQKQIPGCRLFTIEPIKDRSLPTGDMPLLLGIGLEELKEKDKICVLLGCKSPVALRPDGNRYRFVCPVFIDGLWDGQAIKGVETGLYTLDWFEIH